jgi:aminoglycoside phosphotransferase (APT) family kinase protein
MQAEALLAEIETLTGYAPALAHCDLGPEHLLCREGRLVGVIDWADAKIGDPAIDYAWLLNRPFPDFDVEDDLRRRALDLPPARTMVRGRVPPENGAAGVGSERPR